MEQKNITSYVENPVSSLMKNCVILKFFYIKRGETYVVGPICYARDIVIASNVHAQNAGMFAFLTCRL